MISNSVRGLPPSCFTPLLNASHRHISGLRCINKIIVVVIVVTIIIIIKMIYLVNTTIQVYWFIVIDINFFSMKNPSLICGCYSKPSLFTWFFATWINVLIPFTYSLHNLSLRFIQLLSIAKLWNWKGQSPKYLSVGAAKNEALFYWRGRGDDIKR